MHISGSRDLPRGTVSAAQGGDAAALDEVVSYTLPLVYNIVGHALRGHHDVDDLVQETMLGIVRGLPGLREPEAFRSWAVAVTVRQVRWHRAALANRPASTALDEGVEAADPQADFVDLCILRLGLSGQRLEVAEATRWLDSDDQELLALWWLEAAGSLERGELAAALALPSTHAAVRVQRMKQQLDTARGVVRALGRSPRCPGLAGLAEDWDGVPAPLWRKRFARHLRGCADCAACAQDLVPAGALLVGMGLVPLPAGLAAAPSRPGVRAVRRRRAGRSRVRRGGRLYAAMGSGLAVAVVAAASALALGGGRAATPTARALPLPAVTTAGAAPAPSSPAAVHTATPTPTPRPTASRTRKATMPPAAPAGRPAAPVVAVKKGDATWSFDGVTTALRASGASWYYTWGPDHSGIQSPPGVQFVPMIWGPADVTNGSLQLAKQQGSSVLLGFNEPDMASQSNMTPRQALSLWPTLMATGLQLGSPAVATGGATPGGWLDQFMQGARSRGYRVDFITLHWYGGDFVTADAVSQLEGYLQAVHARYGLPVWLTEYALTNFADGGASYPTAQQQAAFVTASTAMLQRLPWVQRYAWFALPDTTPGQTGLFLPGGAPDSVGAAWAAAGR
ncbi:glycosyl hydrolase [Streptacidiphilus sp. PB12-B1b]|uniref:glycosyl hydrolase n=1 Tax=Streptacidiphilus sp. PB12-B1b TaxID=2705012 RepID=UPI0015FC7A4E|nr:glycosyl hydrolase [Streptacidiphilus sp. PB12-B1b]QMU77388.1 glycosyl hydrolase [Streptacidiphilus sp. PB12-B1b]